MIRLTGGSLRGRVLRAPVPAGVRPTSSRAREALFNLLGQDLDGSSWLDLTGGYGLVALEAWSRGARPVVVVERLPAALAVLRRNATELGAALEIRAGDALSLPLLEADHVFADPPYGHFEAGSAAVERWVARARSLARQRAVLEGPSGTRWPEEGRSDLRRYGDTELVFFEPASGEPTRPR